VTAPQEPNNAGISGRADGQPEKLPKQTTYAPQQYLIKQRQELLQNLDRRAASYGARLQELKAQEARQKALAEQEEGDLAEQEEGDLAEKEYPEPPPSRKGREDDQNAGADSDFGKLMRRNAALQELTEFRRATEHGRKDKDQDNGQGHER
jgi:uncharacterized membrane protein